MEYLEAAIRAGAAIGAEYTLVSLGHSGGLPLQERTRRLERSLLRLGRRGTASGSCPGGGEPDPLGVGRLYQLGFLCRTAGAPDHPALCGMCDVVVPFVQGEDPADYPQAAWGAGCGHLHLVDSDGDQRDPSVPGEGMMPLGRVLRDIRAAGYDGAATLELVTHCIDAPLPVCAAGAGAWAKELMV